MKESSKRITQALTVMALGLTGWSPIVFAGGQYDNFTVTELIYSQGAPGVHVVYSGGTGDPNPDGCEKPTRFYIPYTSDIPEREKAMQAAIQVAYATGKPVSVYLLGCQGGIGGLTYPVVWYLHNK